MEEEKLRECHGVITECWKLFKSLSLNCRTDSDKEELIHKAFKVLGDECHKYENTSIYSFAIHYSHALIDQLERSLYPGKPRPEVTRSSQRMTLTEFADYMKNPTPGDMVTVIDEEGGILSRIKVRTVIDT